MDEDHSMEEERSDQIEGGENERIGEDEILKVIPLDEFLDSNGKAAFSDDEDDGEGTSGPVLPDDSIGTLECHEKDIFIVSTAGTRWMASGGEDDRALLFDLEKSETEPVLEITHTDSVTFAVFNKTESLLATGDMSGKIYITELATLQRRLELDDCSDLEWLFWHTTSDILFAGDKEGMVWMWLIGSKGVAQSKIYSAGSGSRCTCGVLLPDGKRLLTGYDDGTVRLWSLRDQSFVSIKLRTEVNTLECHPTLAIAAAGTISGEVRMLSTGTADELSLKKHTSLPPLPPPPREDRMEAEDAPMVEGGNEPTDIDAIDTCVETMAYGPMSGPSAGLFLAVGRNDGTMAVYQLDQAATPRYSFRNDSGQAITRVRWCANGARPLLVTASVDSFVRAHDARDGSQIKELCCAGDAVLELVVLQTDPVCRLLAACGGGSIRVLEVSDEPSA